MAEDNVAAPFDVGKPTFIYGLIDPRNRELRYIGKTVLPPHRRLGVHRWRARTAPHKRHSMAWLLSLEVAGLAPEIVELEVISPGGDWIEAEQFWIGYFRMIGADLCNHTVGGEGQTGYRQPPEMIAKRIKRGPAHHRFGKPMPAHVAEALRAGSETFRADPVRNAAALAKQRAGMTPEAMAPSIAALRALDADPVRRAARVAKNAAAIRRPEVRAKIGSWSKRLWADRRDEIIAAQNAGKGDEWRQKQSEKKRQEWTSPDSNHRRSAAARRKLSDADVAEIRRRLTDGARNMTLAEEYKVDPSVISHIKAGRRR